MNSKTLGILSSIALAAFATPTALYARGGAGGHGSFGGGARTGGSGSIGGARMGAAASRPTSGGRSGGSSNHNGGNWNHNGGNHTGGNWNHNGNGNWNHHGGWDRHCRPHYSNYYYFGGFGYPYYGFGYPYGYGYGYGYPYYGVSATFYNDGGRRYAGQNDQTNGSVVSRVQQRLANAGYYHGAVDGVIGSGTRSAIRAYERANGLLEDGRLDSDLLSRMGVS